MMLFISQSVFAQYSSTFQNSGNNELSNNYESGYINDYAEERDFDDYSDEQHLQDHSQEQQAIEMGDNQNRDPVKKKVEVDELTPLNKTKSK